VPLYEFLCSSCGLKFDGRAPLKDSSKAKPCPACQTEAAPLVPSSVQGHFTKSVTGPNPQNTGIHDLDTHIDRVIGQSAKQGWDVAESRTRDKKEVLTQHPEVDGHSLSKNLDGSYRVMTPEERAVHDRSQAIHGAAMTWHQGQRRPR
jgi:putative FmdB family regulatory protein